MEIFEDRVWQMSLGERAAIEGVLAQVQPRLAVEIGSAEGACLRRIAVHAEKVHSFDLDPPSIELPSNVTLHTGDSHELLPPFLAGLAAGGGNVDFVIVDGDHSAEGVRQDLEDLLDSPALARSVILIHDTVNERVRRGVDAVRFSAWPKVTHVELDWIPGFLFAEPALRNELWYGLGLVLVDSSHLASDNGQVYEQRYHPAAPLLAQIRDLVVARERVAELEHELAATQLEISLSRDRLAGAERALQNIKGSLSWRMTEPLRGAKRLTRGSKR
jgi:hypothetical protein